MPALNQILRRYPYQNGANNPNVGGLPQYAPPPGAAPQGAVPSGVTLPPPTPQYAPGTRGPDPGIAAAPDNMAAWFGSMGGPQFNPLAPTNHTYAANDWRNPQTFQGLQAGMAGMDPAQKYLYAMANRIPGASAGLTAGQMGVAEQGLHGYTMDPRTGQVTDMNGQPVDPSQLLNIMNTNMGGTGQIGSEADSQWRLGQAGTYNPAQFNPVDQGLPGTAADRRQAAIAAGGGPGTNRGAWNTGDWGGGGQAQPQQLGGMGNNPAYGDSMIGMGGGGQGGWTIGPDGMMTPNPGQQASMNPYAVQNYLDPSMAFQMQQGLRGLGSSAAAGGQTYSGNTLKDILGYSQGLASTDYGNAYQRAMQDRTFGYGVQKDTQTIPFQQQMQLAGLGMQGNAINADLSKSLAGLLSANTIAGGQAAGAGTIGGNNALTGMLSQIFGGLQGNSTLQQILARAYPQGTTPAATTA